MEDFQIRLDDFCEVQTFDEVEGLVEDRVGHSCVATDHGEADGCLLMPVLVIDLGGADRELVASALQYPAQDAPLLLEAMHPVEVQADGCRADHHSGLCFRVKEDPGSSPLQCALDLFEDEEFQGVAFLDVVVVGDGEAALESLADLFGIFFEAL